MSLATSLISSGEHLLDELRRFVAPQPGTATGKHARQTVSLRRHDVVDRTGKWLGQSVAHAAMQANDEGKDAIVRVDFPPGFWRELKKVVCLTSSCNGKYCSHPIYEIGDIMAKLSPDTAGEFGRRLTYDSFNSILYVGPKTRVEP